MTDAYLVEKEFDDSSRAKRQDISIHMARDPSFFLGHPMDKGRILEITAGRLVPQGFQGLSPAGNVKICVLPCQKRKDFLVVQTEFSDIQIHWSKVPHILERP